MINTALSSFGAQVVLATSSDEDHPPENMVDGDNRLIDCCTVSQWVALSPYSKKILEFACSLCVCVGFLPQSKGKHAVKLIRDTELPYRKTDTFWLSTGMFPQEFIIRFPDNMKMSVISIHSLNVKHLRIEKSTLQEPEKFEIMTEKEFEHTEGSLQINDIPLDGSNATHLRFLILSGYDHFVSVHRVGVQA